MDADILCGDDRELYNTARPERDWKTTVEPELKTGVSCFAGAAVEIEEGQ